VNAVVRVEQALQLRAKKYTYEEIAAKCGYASRGACHDAVMRELERRVVQNVDALRIEELDSLERLEKLCWERLEDKGYPKGMLFAVDRILAIKERRARLLGLDVPVDQAQMNNVVVVRETPPGYLTAAPAPEVVG
jgi:hypothetical protein